MAGRECFHCKQWVEEGTPHDCWTTTEGALTRDLPEPLQDAWHRLRETAADFGDQRIYASHNSIMFSKKACYFFVRPKMSRLEVCIFLGRPLKDPRVRRAVSASRAKTANLVYITHRDEVESPITDWLQEAYEVSETLGSRGRKKASTPKRKSPRGRKRASKRGAGPKPRRRITRRSKRRG